MANGWPPLHPQNPLPVIPAGAVVDLRRRILPREFQGIADGVLVKLRQLAPTRADTPDFSPGMSLRRKKADQGI